MAYGAESDTEDAAMAIFGVDVPFVGGRCGGLLLGMAMQTAANFSRAAEKKDARST